MNKLILSKKNLLHNLKIIKEKTSSKILAVVKANAYGHGLKEICTALSGKVDFFGVANLQEALAIREFDNTTKVLIMGKCENFALAEKNNISVTIFSKNEFNAIKQRKYKNLKLHLKVDTGMNRLGFDDLDDFCFCLEKIKNSRTLVLEGVFTHFATLRNDIKLFRKQQAKFDKFVNELENRNQVIVHGGGSLTSMFSNTYDMLRYGIFLYGYSFSKLKPVLRVRSQIVHTKQVSKGEYVGYSKAFRAKEDMKVGVIPLGYSDGLPRNFIGKTLFFKKTPLEILSVCMDMTILKIPQNIKVGSTITVFENASNWAKFLKTNEHDILVKFSNFRGKRILK